VPIVTIHRLDSSGDTFNFLTYLADSDPSWLRSTTSAVRRTRSMAVDARLACGIEERRNAPTLQNTPGGIAYIGVSLSASGDRPPTCGYALLENGDTASSSARRRQHQ
jgi:ABC-type phosphate transport system substrate-binding protein